MPAQFSSPSELMRFLHNRRLPAVRLLSVVLLLAGCGGDDGIVFPESTGEGICRVDVSSLDFGLVTLGGFVDRTVTLRNVGEGMLYGSARLDETQEFLLLTGGGVFQLEPGQTRRFSVRYFPSATDSAQASLLIAAGCRVPLLGVGEPPPRCRVVPAVLDFGTITTETVKDLSVTVINDGGGSVALNPVFDAGCGDFSVLGNPPTQVASGDSAQITLRFNPQTPGDQFCNFVAGPDCAPVSLLGRGELPPSCSLSTTSIDFGVVLVGNTAERTLVITNQGGGILNGSFAVDCPEFSVVSGGGGYSLGAEEARTVVLRFAPTSAQAFSCTASSGCGPVALSGRGDAPLCVMEPTRLDFGTLVRGDVSTRSITITNQGGGLLSGTLVSPCDEFVVLGSGAYSLTAQQSTTVQVRFIPDQNGPRSCELGGACASVPMTGVALEPPPVCALSTATLPFGTVVVGESKLLSFTISNTGGGTLSGIVSSPCADFIVDPPTASYAVPAGGSHDVTVRFVPSAVGASTCTLDTGCAETVQATGTGQERAPDCVVTPSSLAFGTVTVGSFSERSFTIENTGGGVLIGDVVSPCAVFTVDPASAHYEVASGGTHTVTVRFTPVADGPTTCSLSTGCATEVALNGTGFLPPPVCELSDTAFDFGTVVLGDTARVTLTVSNTGGSVLEGLLSADCSGFFVEGDNAYSLAGGQSQQFTLAFAPQSPGAANCNLSTGCSSVALSGVGEALPLCRVESTVLEFGSLLVGDTAERTIHLFNDGGGTLEGSVSLGSGCTDFSLLSGAGAYSIAAGDSISITVRYAPSSPGTDACTLNTGCAASVALSGSADLAPVCSLNRTALAFGDVINGESKNLAVSITNTGGGTLTGNLSFSGNCSDFTSLSGTSYSLTAGQTKTFVIRFLPTGFGSYSCTLQSGCGNSISLTGDGVVGFAKHLSPVFAKTPGNGGCSGSGCHSWNYATVTADNFRLLDFGNATNSRFLLKPSGAISHSGGVITTWGAGQSNYNRFRWWVESGAPNN